MSDARHACRECAQIALDIDGVEAADVTDGPVVELTLRGGTVGPDVLGLLARRGLTLDPDRTATRGEPAHTTVVARPA